MLSIYHNPRCSKSRQTLARIEDSGTPVQVILYLQDPPSVDALMDVLQKLEGSVHTMLRSKEARFKELGLSLKDARSDREWLTLVHENPSLLERPIVVSESTAVIGRPPENVNALLA